MTTERHRQRLRQAERRAALAEASASSVSAGAAVSVDIGARHLAVAVGDLGHRVLASRWVTLEHGHGVEAGLAAASGLVDELLDEAGVERELVIGAAVGLPAPISHPRASSPPPTSFPAGRASRSPTELSERLQMPAVVDNDANLGALAEAKWGAGAGGEQVAYIKVATGIGAGLIHDGRLFRGVTGTAGEIGHITVAEDGPICRCGNRGCLELYAGGGADARGRSAAATPASTRSSSSSTSPSRATRPASA